MSTILKNKKSEELCLEVSLLLKSLSHPQRLMILCHLSEGEKNVSELLDLCPISQSQLSQFLIRMKNEGLLESRKEGSYQFYFIKDMKVSLLIKSIEKIFCSNKKGI